MIDIIKAINKITLIISFKYVKYLNFVYQMIKLKIYIYVLVN